MIAQYLILLSFFTFAFTSAQSCDCFFRRPGERGPAKCLCASRVLAGMQRIADMRANMTTTPPPPVPNLCRAYHLQPNAYSYENNKNLPSSPRKLVCSGSIMYLPYTYQEVLDTATTTLSEMDRNSVTELEFDIRGYRNTPGRMFSRFPNLRSLKVNVHYSEVTPHTFAGLPYLEKLSLGGIHHVSQYTFSFLQPLAGTLRHLEINVNLVPYAQTVTPRMFALKSFVVEEGRVEQWLDALRGSAATLEKISFGPNVTGKVDVVMFENMRSLKHLSLKVDDYKNEKRSFVDLVSLETLTLYATGDKCLRDNLFPNSKKLKSIEWIGSNTIRLTSVDDLYRYLRMKRLVCA